MKTNQTPGWKQNLQVIVFYDGWCPFCTKSATNAKRLDFFHLLQIQSFRESGIPETYGLDPHRLEKRLHTTADGNRFYEGIDAITQMVSRLVPLWPLLPVLWMVKWLGLGQKAYDLIASRRTIIPSGGCEDGLCSLEERKNNP